MGLVFLLQDVFDNILALRELGDSREVVVQVLGLGCEGGEVAHLAGVDPGVVAHYLL